MEFEYILTLSFLGLTLAAPLGPVNAEMIKKTISHERGWRLGLITGFGASTGDFTIAMTVLFIGAEVLVPLLEISWLKVTLLLANVIILSYIGISSIRSEINEVEVSEDQNNGAFKQFKLGYLLVISSPWSYAWWASFGPVMLDLGIPLTTFLQRLEATMYFISGILIWVILFNVLLKFSHNIASPKILKFITVSSAILLLAFALKIVLDIICLLVGFCLL